MDLLNENLNKDAMSDDNIESEVEEFDDNQVDGTEELPAINKHDNNEEKLNHIEEDNKDHLQHQHKKVATNNGKNHIFFDDEDDDSNDNNISSSTPAMNHSYSADIDGELLSTQMEEEEEEEDSDAPPDELSVSAGRASYQQETLNNKTEQMRLRTLLKNKRRKVHERNRDQKEKKMNRLAALEKCRLPEDLLSSFKDSPNVKQRNAQLKFIKNKNKMFVDSIDGDFDECIVNTANGIQVKVLDQQIKQMSSIKSTAEAFRHQRLYNRTDRMLSSKLRTMAMKQTKSGKNKLVEL